MIDAINVVAAHHIEIISLLIPSVPEFKCLDKKEILKIADVLQEVSLCMWYYALYL